MARPFRLFTIYDFFSIFIPGLATTFGFYMLLPLPVEVNFIVVLLPILVLAVVFGHALHSTAEVVEKIANAIGIWTGHRETFGNTIADYSRVDDRTIDRFREECAMVLSDPSVRATGNESLSGETWSQLYPTIQSIIYNKEFGRSKTFQALYAFSRSMFVLLAGLPVVYQVHYFFRGRVIDRVPKYILYFPNYNEFIQVASPLCFMGAFLFLISAYQYRRYFVEYLISDFIAIRDS